MTVADVESKYGGISPKGIMMFYGKKGRKKALVKSAKDIPPVAGLPHGFANLSESVADTIDDLFGWNIVPPTSAREMERGPEGLAGGEFTVQEWVPDSKTMSVAVDYDKRFVFFDAHYDRVMKMAVLDFIIANRDRHTGNIIVTNRTKQIYAIDHGFSFDSDVSGYFVPNNDLTFRYVSGKTIPENIMHDLRELEEGDLRAAVAPLGPTAVDGAVKRWKLLVQKGKMPGTNWRGFFLAHT